MESVQLIDTPEKGKGTFALRAFEKGEIVVAGLIEEVLDENDEHACQIGKNNFARLNRAFAHTNHSCDPNCGIRENAAGAHDLVARRPISVNEEITFDYAMQNYVIEHFGVSCRCGAKNCRGEILGWRNLTKAKKDEYKRWAAPYLIEMD